jgi:hypothetical protein
MQGKSNVKIARSFEKVSKDQIFGNDSKISKFDS